MTELVTPCGGGAAASRTRVLIVAWGAPTGLVVLPAALPERARVGPSLITVSWVLCDCGPARAAQEWAGGPAGAYGGVLQRGAGLPVGVVPAAARARDVARGAEIARLRMPLLRAAGQAGSQRKPLLSSQMMASPSPAMPLMPASACGQNSPGS